VDSPERAWNRTLSPMPH